MSSRSLILTEVVIVLAICLFYADSKDPLYLLSRVMYYGARWRFRFFSSSDYPASLSADAKSFFWSGRLFRPAPASEWTVADARAGTESFSRLLPAPPSCVVTRASYVSNDDESSALAAYWLTTSNTTSADDHNTPTIVYAHGGGFVTGDLTGYRSLCCRLAHDSGVRVLFVNYRTAPEHVLPAAYDDLFGVYQWLINPRSGAGVSPQNVVLYGDSAGGGMVLNTVQRARHERLPQPAAAVVFSPWLDLTLSAPSLRSGTDWFLTTERLEWFRSLATNNNQMPAIHTAALSPAKGSVDGLCPFFVAVSRTEVLYDDTRRFEKACIKAGTPITVAAVDHMIHNFPLFAFYFPEAANTYRQAIDFARAKLADSTASKGRTKPPASGKRGGADDSDDDDTDAEEDALAPLRARTAAAKARTREL